VRTSNPTWIQCVSCCSWEHEKCADTNVVPAKDVKTHKV
jgi:hypothetical protein